MTSRRYTFVHCNDFGIYHFFGKCLRVSLADALSHAFKVERRVFRRNVKEKTRLAAAAWTDADERLAPRRLRRC